MTKTASDADVLVAARKMFDKNPSTSLFWSSHLGWLMTALNPIAALYKSSIHAGRDEEEYLRLATLYVATSGLEYAALCVQAGMNKRPHLDIFGRCIEAALLHP